MQERIRPIEQMLELNEDEANSTEHLDSQVQKAQEQLFLLKKQQEQIEKQKREMEELSRRQEELERGRAGVLALLLTSLCPALVSRGAIVIVDTFSTFFTLATLLVCHQMQRQTTAASAWRWTILAGGLAGCAFTSKYTVGAVFLAVLVTIALMPMSVKSRALLVLLAGVGLVAGSILTMPMLVMRFGAIVETIRNIATFYDSVPSKPGYWGAALTQEELGLPLVATGLLGVVLMLRHERESRHTALAWLAFGALLIGALIRSDFQPLRNLLPLVPFVCIAAAFFVVRASDYFLPRSRHVSSRWLFPAAGLLVAFSLALPVWKHFRERTSHIDSRVTAIDWLRKNASARDRILALQELAILPAEWKRLPSPPVLVSWPAALKLMQNEHFDYVVASEFELRFTRGEPGPARFLTRWREAVAGFPVAAAFGYMPNLIVPGVWRSNDECILILRPTPPPAVTSP